MQALSSNFTTWGTAVHLFLPFLFPFFFPNTIVVISSSFFSFSLLHADITRHVDSIVAIVSNGRNSRRRIRQKTLHRERHGCLSSRRSILGRLPLSAVFFSHAVCKGLRYVSETPRDPMLNRGEEEKILIAIQPPEFFSPATLFLFFFFLSALLAQSYPCNRPLCGKI